MSHIFHKALVIDMMFRSFVRLICSSLVWCGFRWFGARTSCLVYLKLSDNNTVLWSRVVTFWRRKLPVCGAKTGKNFLLLESQIKICCGNLGTKHIFVVRWFQMAGSRWSKRCHKNWLLLKLGQQNKQLNGCWWWVGDNDDDDGRVDAGVDKSEYERACLLK